MSGAVATIKGVFEEGEPVKYWLDNVKCKGDEQSLFDCPRSGRAKMIGYHNCGRRERAGVHCLICESIIYYNICRHSM